jgi:UDP-N-acetyl-2-amino-2-deoxyglucuronate dehydrogenase
VTAPKQVRIALVGCGRISGNHFEAIAQIPELQLTAVCDIVPERARAAGEKLGVPHWTSYERMLAEGQCEMVTVATPSGLHPEHGLMAARAGKHVITEKPIAISLAGADALIEGCDAAGVRLFVVKQNRLNAPVQLLRNAIESGRFGRIYVANVTVYWTRPQDYYDQAPWRGTRALDGGALMNQASHYVDLIQWLMGPPRRVAGITGTLARNIECEDTGLATIEFESGAMGAIVVTMLTYPRTLEGSITILGERGTVKIGGTAVNRVEHWSFDSSAPEDDLVASASTNPPNVYGYGHLGYYRNVLKVLSGEATPDTDGREGRKSLELILAIYESARTGEFVSLPLLP